MKYFVIAALIVLSVSCSKEVPTPTPVSPVPGKTNFVVLNGDGYVNDTIEFNSGAWYQVVGQYTNFTGSGLTGAVSFSTIGTNPGSYNFSQNYPYGTSFDGIQYQSPNFQIEISDTQSGGSLIACDFFGSYKKSSDTTITITVSGKMNATLQ